MTKERSASQVSRLPSQSLAVVLLTLSLVALAGVASQACGTYATAKPWPYSFISSVDTMKESKDAEAKGLTNAQIVSDVNLAARLNTTHITVDTQYDYPAVMAQWVQAVRATGKHVWFRPGGFGITMVSPSWYLSNMSSYIIANPGLFKPSDIFDADPEAENSAYWVNEYGSNGINTTNGAAAFNQFLRDLTATANRAFAQIGVTGVMTTVHSTDPGTSLNVLTSTTVQDMGNLVTVDAYPDENTTDPTTAASDWSKLFSNLHSKWPTASLLVGEYGYCNNIDVGDSTQEAVVKSELNNVFSSVSYLVGVNYWVGAGGAGYGGYTNIFKGSKGNWSLRPAANDLSAFYAAKTSGS